MQHKTHFDVSKRKSNFWHFTTHGEFRRWQVINFFQQRNKLDHLSKKMIAFKYKNKNAIDDAMARIFNTNSKGIFSQADIIKSMLILIFYSQLGNNGVKFGFGSCIKCSTICIDFIERSLFHNRLTAIQSRISRSEINKSSTCDRCGIECLTCNVHLNSQWERVKGNRTTNQILIFQIRRHKWSNERWHEN